MFGKPYRPAEEVTEENYKRVFAKELLALFLSGVGIGAAGLWLAFGLAEIHSALRGAAFFIFVVAGSTYLMWDGIKQVVEWWAGKIAELNSVQEDLGMDELVETVSAREIIEGL